MTVYKEQETKAEWRKPWWNQDDRAQLEVLLRDPVKPAIYWVHHTFVKEPGSFDSKLESIWLWEASQRFAKAKHCLKHVLVKKAGKWQFTQTKES